MINKTGNGKGNRNWSSLFGILLLCFVTKLYIFIFVHKILPVLKKLKQKLKLN
jgi:hypothetical protein